jgi:LmbE family N-acetylglucosaminyl deacetylase
MHTFPIVRPNVELLYNLQSLSMACTVLHIGAHPDDEDVGLIAYLARHRHVRVVYWSATRGEGGENRVGPYKGDALGLYRTWESLSAREIDGGEAMFGPFYDFGFSKSGEETLRKWGREMLIREIVRAIRLVQPAVVISRWAGVPQDGHGHHQAIGMVVWDAYKAAGDPAQFEDLKLSAWQPRKFYCSTLGDWEPGVNTPVGKRVPEYECDGYVRVNTGIFDPYAGRTYQEQAWIGFKSHKTQAMGFAPGPGDFFYYYRLLHSVVPQQGREQDLFDGLDRTLTGLAVYPGLPSGGWQLFEQIKMQVYRAVDQYRAGCTPEAAISLLAALEGLRDLLAQLLDDPSGDTQALACYLSRIEANIEMASAQCLGLRLECLSDDARVCPGQAFEVRVQLWNQEGVQISHPDICLNLPDGWSSVLKNPIENRDGDCCCLEEVFRVTVPQSASLATSYWLRKPHGLYAYDWDGAPETGLPLGQREVGIVCRVLVGERAITLRETAVLREAFAGGFRELQVAVVPPISIHPNERQICLPVSMDSQVIDLAVILRSNTERDDVGGHLALNVPHGWHVAPDLVDVSLGETGSACSLKFTVTIPPGAGAGQYGLQYGVMVDGRDYNMILEPVRMVAPGLPGFPDETNCIQEEFIATPAETTVNLIDVEVVPELKYAFIKGSDEHLADSLAHFPLEFYFLDDNDLGYADLSQFDAVIIGPDAYLVRDELCKNAGRFLDYTAGGGTLIVLRQGYAYQKGGYAPYPIRFHEPNDEVTFEDVPVSRLQPDHPLLNQPNAISDNDFAGWVMDRGNFFIGEWDAHYEALLACNDPGEEPKCGGLLVARYGRGAYLYCAYSLCRQISAGVPGAFRLLANILALPIQRVLIRSQWLKSAPIFSTLPKNDLLEVARIAVDSIEDSGIYLCHEGDLADKIYLIVQGQVEIVKESEEGKIISTAGPGEVIGELGVLADLPQHVAMHTCGEVHLLALSGAGFLALMHEHYKLMERVIQVMSAELVSLRSY